MPEGTEAVVRAYVEACNGDDLDQVKHHLTRFEAHWSSFHWEPLEFRQDGFDETGEAVVAFEAAGAGRRRPL